MTGLYVHIPFCVRKCAYCDFYSVPDRLHLTEVYVDAVLREAEAYAGLDFHSLYLGGGTPSLLGTHGLMRLVDGLCCTFGLSDLAEATMEVNPNSAGSDLLLAARDAGIDRLSIGVQSLSDPELQKVGRVHTAAQAADAVVRAVEVGFSSVSADVMVGLPGQRWATLRSTLVRLTELGVDHLSLYCLSLEEGTPLATNPPDDLPPDDVQANLFEQATLFLENRGFRQYEISNFALPGCECRHNASCWRGGEYLGLGAAASSHLQGRRFKNAADVEAYIRNPTGVVEEVEKLDARDKAAEEAMLRLRLVREGLVLQDLDRRFGRRNIDGLVRRLDDMVGDGQLTFDGSAYRLPRSRVLTSNPILARVLGEDHDENGR